MKIIEVGKATPTKEKRQLCTITMDMQLVKRLNRYKKSKGKLSKSKLICDLLNNYLEGKIK